MLQKKNFFYLLSGLFGLFLLVHYWERFIGFLGAAWSASVPLIAGACFAYVLNILMMFYQEHFWKKSDGKKFKKPVCLALAFVTLLALTGFVIGQVLPELVKAIQQLIVSVPRAFTTLEKLIYDNQALADFLAELGINQQVIDQRLPEITDIVATAANHVLQWIATFLGSTFSTLVMFIIAVIFSVYMLLGKERLLGQWRTFLSIYLPKQEKHIRYVCDVLNNSFHHFIVGQCLEAVILGVLCTVGMTIFRFPYAVMIGTLTGFAALIPIVGAWLGALVGAFMIITISPVKAFWFLVFLLVLQQLEGNLIYPRVVGKSIGLPGIYVLAAVTIGGSLFGVGGILVSVPLLAAAYRLIREDIAFRKSAAKAVSQNNQ